MRELKILAIVVLFSGILYWGVEPLAHSVFHPEVAPPDYNYSDLPEPAKGDPESGEQLAAMFCISCHSIESAGFPAPMADEDAAATYGVVPPDLSKAGAIYHDRYLQAFIDNPAVAAQTDKISMPSMGLDAQQVADITAWLQEIAPRELGDEEVYQEACARCHSLRYQDWELSETRLQHLKRYLGSNPPDLSMMIRSRGEHYLHNFINDPQKMLPGTAMQRTGLTREREAQIVHYLEQTGDPKKSERQALGPWIIGFFVVMSIFAFLWKKAVFKEHK